MSDPHSADHAETTDTVEGVKELLGGLEDVLGGMADVIAPDSATADQMRAELRRTMEGARAEMDQPGMAEAIEARVGPVVRTGLHQRMTQQGIEIAEALNQTPITDDEDKDLFRGLLDLIEVAELNGCHNIFVGAPNEQREYQTTAHRYGIEALGEQETVVDIPGDPADHLDQILKTLPRSLQRELSIEGGVMFILDEETPGPDWRVEILPAAEDDSPIPFVVRLDCPEVFDDLAERAQRLRQIRQS